MVRRALIAVAAALLMPTIAFAQSSGITALTGNTTYYVSNAGSDSNTGLADDPSHAWATLQHANDAISQLNLATYHVTVQVDAGSYAGMSCTRPYFAAAINAVTYIGSVASPDTVVVSGATGDGPYGDAFYAGYGCTYIIEGFKVTSSVAFGVHAAYGGNIVIGGTFSTQNMDFGSVPSGFAQLYSEFNGVIQVGVPYEITGSGTWHMLAEDAGNILHYAGQPVTVTIANVSYAQSFVRANNLGYVRDFNFTYSGSATGQRYQVMGNGVISTQGGGPNYEPGTVAGTTSTGGQYQ